MLRVDPYPSALAFAASERLELDLCRLPQIDSHQWWPVALELLAFLFY